MVDRRRSAPPSSSASSAPSAVPPSFVVALCKPGFEPAVVTELGHDGLRMSFRRPGFVSFKSDRPLVAADVRELSLVFPRRLGLAAGPFEDDVAAVDRAVAIAEAAEARVVVLSREGLLPDDAPDLVDDEARRLQGLINARYHSPPLRLEPPIVEVIRVDGEGADSRWIVIKAIAGPLRYAGGFPSVEIPAESPSRAFRKLEDAVARFGLDVGADDIAVEVGASPGGVTLALLRRGARVTAIDPNSLDAGVLAAGPVKHLCIPVEKISLSWLPPATFLFLDMNQPPRSALAALAPVADALLPTLRAAVLTLKMGDRVSLDEIPHWHAIVRRMFPGFSVEMAHLPGNKSEISVGLRRQSF